MKQQFSRRILSLLLAFVLLVSSVPVAGAAEAETVPESTAVPTVPVEATEEEQAATEAETPETTLPSEPEMTEPAEETEATEATEPAEETEATEATEPAEETEATEATEPVEETEATEATDPTEETEATEATEPTEETEPVELPYGFAGLPEGYVLSELAMEKKTAMLENAVLEALGEMIPGEDYAEDQVLVAAESEEEAALMAEAFSGDLLRYNDGIAVIRLLTATVYEAVEASLDMALPLPAATPNYIVRVSPIVSNPETMVNGLLPEEQSWQTWVQENMTNPDPALMYPDDSDYQWMHDAVDTYAAWGVTTGESWVKVAIIDTGVYANHPDLRGKITEYDVGLGKGDGYGHGTCVAGIIAATMDNGLGGAGIAPGVSIHSYRIADADGSMYLEQELRAIKNAVSNGAHIISMSFSGPVYIWDEQYEIQKAVERGVTVISSMGNTGSNTMQYPAAYDGVIAVAATDRNNKRAYFSSYGNWADLCAPGTDIYTASNDGSYDWFGGTSAAAPIVAGVAALYTSAYGNRVAPATMEKLLKAAATKVSESGMGKGLVNAANMFDDKPEAPYVLITDGTYEYDPSKPVPSDAVAYFFDSESAAMGGHYENMDGVFVYTLDGKNPSVKNGEVVNGYVIGEPAYLELAGLIDSKVTVKIAHVSGMGIVGKIRTLKLTVTGTDYVEGVTVHGSSEVIAGKSSTYTATVYPADTAKQDVTWKITYRSNAGMEGVKISNTGKLTTPKNQSGYVLIQATSVADPSYKSDAFRVNIKHFEPVSKVELRSATTGAKATTGYSYVGHYLELEAITYAKQAGSSQLVQVQREVRWSSSNNRVAYVGSDGAVYALSKGTATITCTVLDGSGKTAKCKITVRQPVEEVTITGQASIAPGASATYKAKVAPSNAHIKKVDWSLQNAPNGVTISPSSGKVTVQSHVRLGSSFYVVATSKDEDKASTRYQVTVRQKCTSVNVVAASSSCGYAPGPVYSGSYVKSVKLFSVDMPDSSGRDNYIDLNQKCSGYSNAAVEWSSSNPKVASVDEAGRVTAHKAGTANITVKASDGSNKKATVKVTVTNPVSSMSIKSNAPQMTISMPFIGFGKTVKNTVSFSDTYGVPNNKKVTWDFRVYEVDSYGDVVRNYTSTFKNMKLISVDKNGTLSAKKGLESYWYEMGGDLVIDVYAYATDGTDAYAVISYFAIPLTKKMYMDSADKSGTIRSDRTGYAQFYCDQWNVLWNDWNYAFTATSSNPKVAGVTEIYPLEGNDGWYEIVFRTGKYGTSGTAKITIKAADGSNKSCSFTLKVVP